MEENEIKESEEIGRKMFNQAKRHLLALDAMKKMLEKDPRRGRKIIEQKCDKYKLLLIGLTDLLDTGNVNFDK